MTKENFIKLTKQKFKDGNLEEFEKRKALFKKHYDEEFIMEEETKSEEAPKEPEEPKSE